MSDRKQKFAHETELEPDGVIALFEDLLAGLRSGELNLAHGDQVVALHLNRAQGPVEVSIAARRKSGRESLRVELEWCPRDPEPVLEIGPAQESGVAPISARRRSIVAPRELRGPGPAAAPTGTPTVEHPLDPARLLELPKERLYALAQAVELDGRSQLHKTALAEALAEHDLRPHLSAEDLLVLSGADEQD